MESEQRARWYAVPSQRHPGAWVVGVVHNETETEPFTGEVERIIIAPAVPHISGARTAEQLAKRITHSLNLLEHSEATHARSGD